jgi:hypothetical protein
VTDMRAHPLVNTRTVRGWYGCKGMVKGMMIDEGDGWKGMLYGTGTSTGRLSRIHMHTVLVPVVRYQYGSRTCTERFFLRAGTSRI